MATISQGGGFGGFSRRPSKGFGPGKSSLALAAKHNEIVAANLKLGMDAVPKYLLGAYAATVLDTAIKNTKHDSSRFAANWNLIIGSTQPPEGGKPIPYSYNETGKSFGAIGEKGGHGSHRRAVLMSKRAYYGYAKDGEFMKLTKGRLAEALFPRAGSAVAKVKGKSSTLSGAALDWRDKGGTPPKIYLYNPFMRPDYVPFRKSGWHPLHGDTSQRSGKTYPHYALPRGEMPYDDVSMVVGHGLVQSLIQTLAGRMRRANVANIIMDPFL